MKRLLVIFPTAWDRRHLDGPGGSREVLFEGPHDEECPWDFPIPDFLARVEATYRGRVDGVLGTSDYPGAQLAAVLAARLGLPGPPPRSVLTASHKYASRVAQQKAVPEAVPAFHLVRPGDPPRDLPFPAFVKPVKGSFSMLARRVETPRELAAHLSSPAAREYLDFYVALFEALRADVAPDLPSARAFLAEGCLQGTLVTVEGYSTADEVRFLGIVDSEMDPVTGSFQRFHYPSALPESVQARMREIARRVVRALGLFRTTWNLEMFHDPHTDRVSIVEVNPRLAGQFADLYEKVDGVNGYEVAAALALGETPPGKNRRGRFPAAASTPLRCFTPSRVLRTPDPAAVASVEREHPGTLVWVECAPGQDLCDFDIGEDGQSCRYAVVNQGGGSRAEITARFESIRRHLGFAFEALRP